MTINTYDDFKNKGTSGYNLADEYKIIVQPFDKYEIKIKLSAEGKFVDIVEVKINKRFLSQKQKISSFGVHNVDDFYKEKE